MNIIGRVLIILIAAAVISGGLMAATSAGYTAILIGPGRAEMRSQSTQGTSTSASGIPNTNTTALERGGEHQGGAPGFMGLGEIGKNFAIITMIVAIGALLSFMQRSIRPRRIANTVRLDG